MKNIFPAYYDPSEEEFVAAWNDAVFVLDTNILLNLYRYPQQPRDDFLNSLRKLGERLWIPFHVGLEYQRNRPGQIKLRRDRFAEVESELKTAVSTLRGKLGGKKQLIDVNPLLQQMDDLVQSFNDSLPAARANDPVTFSSDPIRDQLDQILADRVGPPPSEAQLAAWKKEAEHRYQHAVPPGYLDAKKDAGGNPDFSYGGLIYQAKHGDYILWSQLMSYAKEQNISKVIFLTDDEKEDWCKVIETTEGKRKRPRPELIEEIRREAQVTFFYLYNSDSFLSYAKKYLHAKVEDASIKTVHDVLKETKTSKNALQERYLVHNSYVSLVMEWLATLPGCELISRDGTTATLNIQNDTIDVAMFRVTDLAHLSHEVLRLTTDVLVMTPNRPKVVILLGSTPSMLRAMASWIATKPTLATEHFSVLYGEISYRGDSPEAGIRVEFSEVFTPRLAYGSMAETMLWWSDLLS